jgi:S-adenosylmethionine hydrolase
VLHITFSREEIILRTLSPDEWYITAHALANVIVKYPPEKRQQPLLAYIRKYHGGYQASTFHGTEVYAYVNEKVHRVFLNEEEEDAD